jgi:NADH-quinone oxidoreductase subunit G
VTRTGELAFFQRGERTMIGIFPGKPLDNLYSGNVVDLCPVGALTLKEFRFQTRVWYLRNTPSICAGCARGCNVVVGTGTQQVLMTTQGQQDDRIKRMVSRVNEEVNGHWICDEGRLSFQRVQSGERLLAPQSPVGTEIDWDEAVSRAATTLRAAAEKGRAGALLSPRLPCEDLFAWKSLFSKLGKVRVGVLRLHRGEDDALLIRADKGANSTGAKWILGEAATESSVEEAVGRGELEALLVVGDPLDPADTATIDPARRSGVGEIVFVGPFVSGAASVASVLLPTSSWSEEDGTFVNFEGRIQRARRCHLPRGQGRPGWKVASEIAAAIGADLPAWTSADEVLAALASSVAAFQGLDAESIGLLGVPAAPASV